MNYQLLEEFIRVYPFQPATAFWRAIEIAVILEHSLLTGRGLDLGCGDGKLTQIIFENKENYSLVGIDPDRQETQQASNLDVYKTVHTVAGSNIPENSGTFDFVFSNSVLEHIPELEPVLAEVSRLLKPDGIFLFSVPYADFHACLKGPRLRRISKDQYFEEMNLMLALHHCPTLEQWKAMLQQVDITIKHSFFYLNEAEVQRWELLTNLTGGLLFRLFQKRSHPIEIQRQLGLRNLQNRFNLPRFLAKLIARVITIGMHHNQSSDEPKYGGIIVEGIKRSTPAS